MRNSIRTALGAFVATLGMAASSTALPANAEPAHPGGHEAGALHSLRSPVTSENFYFVMADRFKNGDTANDTGGLGDNRLASGFDPTGKGFYNGGDLKGITSKLDYIQGLGTRTLPHWCRPRTRGA